MLDLIDHVTDPKSLGSRGHKGKVPKLLVSLTLTEDVIKETLEPSRSHKMVRSIDGIQREYVPRDWALRKMQNKVIACEFHEKNSLIFSEFYEPAPPDQLDKATMDQIGGELAQRFKMPFDKYEFRRIVADRDIAAEIVQPADKLRDFDIKSNGAGVTALVQRFLTAAWLDPEPVADTLLNDLNSIFRPDADYYRIHSLQMDSQAGDGKWELYLEEETKGRIPMSETGSGLKTVLLVLANLILVPLIKPRPLKEFLFGFEELENNLHPAIQRRLFRYPRDKAVSEGCYFFITTHSNVVIDLFACDPDAQILHVTHNGEYASVSTVETSGQCGTVLDDLDVRASDLLQTNAIVWVEGPSDRIYFNRWIDLWSGGKLVEGIHYQCLPLGGSCNAHVSFEDPVVVDDLIATLRVNRHAVFLADSDRRRETDVLKPQTKRLAEEVTQNDGYAWITDGKEVENYIPSAIFRELLDDEEVRGPERFTDVFNYLKQKKSNATAPRKTELAKKVAQILTRELIANTPGMAAHLDAVCTLIGDWNKADSTPIVDS